MAYQFDPDILQRFIEVRTAGDSSRRADPITYRDKVGLAMDGLEIERHACAIEAKNIAVLSAMIKRLATLPTKHELPQVAEITE